MRRLMVFAALLASAGAAGAQELGGRPMEFRGLFGGNVATGAMRDVMQDALLLSAQCAVQLRPALHAVGTFGWMPARAIVDGPNDKVNVLQYDAGLELGLARRRYSGGQLLTYVGVGGGVRLYTYENDALDDHTGAVGVGSLGAEWKMGAMGLRAELRDNVFRYRAPGSGGESGTRNDVGMLFGVVYHFQ